MKHFAGPGLIWLQMRERITRTDLQDLYQLLYAAPEPPERRWTYVDLGQVSAVDVGFREIHWISIRSADIVRRAGWHLRISIHAPTPVTFGVSRMYQQLFGSNDFAEVFVSENPQEALDWLDLPELPDMPVPARLAQGL